MSDIPKKYRGVSFGRGLLVFCFAIVISVLVGYGVYMSIFGEDFDWSRVTVNSYNEKNIATNSNEDLSVNIPRLLPVVEDSTVVDNDESSEDVELIETNTSEGVISDQIANEEDNNEVIDKSLTTELADEVITITNDTLAYYIIQGFDNFIYDLRSQSEFDAGRIRTSQWYNVNNFSTDDFQEGQSYVLICGEGVCDDARRIIAQIQGIVSAVEVLEGGFDAWQSEGFRVISESE